MTGNPLKRSAVAGKRRGGPPARHTDSVSDVVAVLLAAGGGSRFNGPTHKLLAPLPANLQRPAEPVVARALAALIEADIGPIVIVTGAVGITADELGLSQSMLATPSHERFITVPNPRWADGQATSVQTGVDAARRLEASSMIIGLGDQPGINPDTWRAIANAATSATIAVATYDGQRGNPVALGSDIWDLLPEEGDEGARSLMRLRPDLVVEVPCSGSPEDIDTTEDLRRWQNNSSTNSP